MVQGVQAHQVTLAALIERYELEQVEDPTFFSEWAALTEPLTELEIQLLDRVRTNFRQLLDKPRLLENSVKMVVLAPLLDLAGFYRKPFSLESEASIEIEVPDREEVIRGRIDVLVLKRQLWLLAVESKRSEFAVNIAFGQALSCMMANPDQDRPTFGLICNGTDFIFLKLVRNSQLRYAHSRLFSLLNPGNELYEVLGILKHLGQVALMA